MNNMITNTLSLSTGWIVIPVSKASSHISLTVGTFTDVHFGPSARIVDHFEATAMVANAIPGIVWPIVSPVPEI